MLSLSQETKGYQESFWIQGAEIRTVRGGFHWCERQFGQHGVALSVEERPTGHRQSWYPV